MSNVGLQVVEGIAKGSTPFVNPAIRNIGLLMERERGVEGVAVKFSSQDDDSRLFGGEFPNTFGSYVVRTLFANAVNIPATLYGVRVIGSGCVSASLSQTVATRTVLIKAGRQGQEDKGTWGNNLKCLLYSYNLKNRNAFTLEVYYKGELVETFFAATCALLQSQINSVSDFIIVTFSGEIAQDTTTTTNGTGTWTKTTTQTVTGVGTAFLTEAAVGDILMYFGTRLGKITAIADDTHLTLAAADVQFPYANSNFGATAVPTVWINTPTAFVSSFQLTGGVYHAPVEADYYPSVPNAPAKTGLSVLDGVDVQLIAVTENHTLTMAQQGNLYCLGRKDATFIANLPLASGDAMCNLYALALQTNNKSYIAGYNFWADILDSNGNDIVVPALGVILGAGYLTTPYVQGNFPHIPPAGVDSVFQGIQDIIPGKIDAPTLNRRTRDFTVNSAQFKQGTGWYIATSRTYSTNQLYMSVHSNIMASYYVRYIQQNMDFVNQKPNTPDLRNRLLVSLTNFFKDQYEIGALDNDLTFAQACVIICDRSNNPLNGDRKQLNASVAYIITEAVEATLIALNRNDGILTTNVVTNDATS
jgi:hypothetical protein